MRRSVLYIGGGKMRILIGDIFESDCRTLVNTVNCVGVMGKGIAKCFKERYPDMYKDYKRRCTCGVVRPGTPYLFDDILGTSILNFPTKDHWRSPSRLSYIREGLDWFCAHWDELGITSIAFPPLGCGNGGLNWREVGPIMYEKLKGLPIDIEIYAPYGTPLVQLGEECLANAPMAVGELCGDHVQTYNRAWDLILHVIAELDKSCSGPYVGRTIYQKICFMLWRLGVPLGFEFQRGDFGPYSPDAQAALTIFANSNRITERVVGQGHKMVRISPSESFVFDPIAFDERELLVARNVIDFFGKMKNTAQAEEFTTLLWCYDEQRKGGAGGLKNEEPKSISADSLVSSAIEWKPRWDSPEMKKSLCSQVFALMMEGWIDPSEVTYRLVPEELF